MGYRRENFSKTSNTLAWTEEVDNYHSLVDCYIPELQLFLILQSDPASAKRWMLIQILMPRSSSWPLDAHVGHGESESLGVKEPLLLKSLIADAIARKRVPCRHSNRSAVLGARKVDTSPKPRYNARLAFIPAWQSANPRRRVPVFSLSEYEGGASLQYHHILHGRVDHIREGFDALSVGKFDRRLKPLPAKSVGWLKSLLFLQMVLILWSREIGHCSIVCMLSIFGACLVGLDRALRGSALRHSRFAASCLYHHVDL